MYRFDFSYAYLFFWVLLASCSVIFCAAINAWHGMIKQRVIDA